MNIKVDSEHKVYRILYVDNLGYDGEIVVRPVVAEILSRTLYCVMGNSSTMLIREIRKDWGKHSKWGRYIRITFARSIKVKGQP